MIYVQSKIQRALPANNWSLAVCSHIFSSYWAIVFSLSRTRTSAVWTLRQPRLCYSCCLASTGPCLGTSANFLKTPNTKWSTRTSGVTFLSFLVPYSVTSLITTLMVLVSIWLASDNFNWIWNSVTGSGEIIPTRCNNCVYSSQWLYSTCFGWQFHPSSGVQCCIGPFR